MNSKNFEANVCGHNFDLHVSNSRELGAEREASIYGTFTLEHNHCPNA